jgi:hypothetical protein
MAPLRTHAGEHSAMIEWSWRIETETSMVCGSWNDEADWGSAFNALIGRTIEDVSLHGRLPELIIALSGKKVRVLLHDRRRTTRLGDLRQHR